MGRYSLLVIVCVFMVSAIRGEAAMPQPSVLATLSSSVLAVTNTTNRPICYVVHESNILTRIEWGPICSDNNQIAPHTSVQIPVAPDHFEPSGEAVFSWWFKGNNAVEGHLRFDLRPQPSSGVDVYSDR
jgi:hypothetical protein